MADLGDKHFDAHTPHTPHTHAFTSPHPHFSPSAYTQQAKTMMSRRTLLSLLALAITPTATLSSASISILDAHYPWDDQPLGFSLDKFDFTTSFGDKRTASLYIPAKGK